MISAFKSVVGGGFVVVGDGFVVVVVVVVVVVGVGVVLGFGFASVRETERS